MADASTGAIYVNNQGKKLIVVELDGRLFQQETGQFFFLSLEPGLHDIKIFAARHNKKSSLFRNPAKAGRLIYASSIQVKPFVTIQLCVPERGNLLYIETVLPTPAVQLSDRFDNRAPYYHEMEPQKFDAIMLTLRRESFDKTRLELVSQIMTDQYFTTNQVMKMIPLFAFEYTKLEFAKRVYSRTIDKENFFQVYNLFAFSNSKSQLAAYISEHG